MLSLASNRVHGFLRSSGKSLHQRQRFFPHNSARNDRIVYVNGLLKCGYSSTALTAAKTLVIVESPAKAKTIQKFLDEMKVKKNNMEGVAGSNSDTDEYIIDSCMGHINDLATGSKEVPVEYQQRYVHPKLSVRIADLGVDVHNNFKPIYVPLPGKAEVIRRLSSTAKTVDRILLATDEDREGEAISWFLVQALKPKVPYQRAVFHEITKSAIEHSFQHPREIDMNLVRAQETRRILDKIAGFTLSPLLWRYIASGLSAGRVQSCGLNLIAEKEKERWKFVKSNYFTLETTMQCPSSPSSSSASTAEMMKVFQAKVHQLNGSKIADESDFDGHTGKVKSNKIVVLDEEKAIQTARWLTGNLSSSSHHVNFIVHDKTERKTHRSAPLPFITSSLQQDASQKLGFSPTRTMSVAQKLYENGYITYMRTDSPTLSQQALAIAKETVKQRYGEEYLDSFGEGEGKGYGHKQGSSTNKMKNPPKNAQEAHEAIRPATTDSNQFRDPEEVMRSSALELDEKRLYDLIYKRTIASVMKSSQSITTTLTIHAKDDVEGSKYNSNKDHSHDDHSSWSAVLKSSETFMEFPGYSIVYQGRGNKGKERSRSKLLFEKIGIGDRLLLAQTNDNHSWKSSVGSMEEDGLDETEENHHDGETVGEKSDGDDLSLSTSFPGIRCSGHETRPPSRYTESSFVKELETLGVGRPSTYAKILQVLKERGYIMIDRQTVLPTIKGLLVAQFLRKEFPDFINSEFTATMEESLDLIANGLEDKDVFLKKFYFGDNDSQDHQENVEAGGATVGSDGNLVHNTEQHQGLLTTIVKKLEQGSIDHKTSRMLTLPFLQDIGVLSMSKAGVFVQPSPPATSTSNEEKSKSWKLPLTMEMDIRTLSKESIANLMEREVSSEGKQIGFCHHPYPSYPDEMAMIVLKSGRFGKYLEVSPSTENLKEDSTTKSVKKIYYSIPQWVDDSLTLSQALDFMSLPKLMEFAPSSSTFDKPFNVSLVSGVLSISVEGHPYRAEVPAGLYVQDITPALAEELLSTSTLEAISLEKRELGLWENKMVTIQSGRFGPYLKAGSVICGFGKKYKPETITLEEASMLLAAKLRKSPGSKSKGKKKQTVAVTKPSDVISKEVVAALKQSNAEEKVKAKKSTTKKKNDMKEKDPSVMVSGENKKKLGTSRRKTSKVDE